MTFAAVLIGLLSIASFALEAHSDIPAPQLNAWLSESRLPPAVQSAFAPASLLIPKPMNGWLPKISRSTPSPTNRYRPPHLPSFNRHNAVKLKSGRGIYCYFMPLVNTISNRVLAIAKPSLKP